MFQLNELVSVNENHVRTCSTAVLSKISSASPHRRLVVSAMKYEYEELLAHETNIKSYSTILSSAIQARLICISVNLPRMSNSSNKAKSEFDSSSGVERHTVVTAERA